LNSRAAAKVTAAEFVGDESIPAEFVDSSEFVSDEFVGS
jgi:hypothetical protein